MTVAAEFRVLAGGRVLADDVVGVGFVDDAWPPRQPGQLPFMARAFWWSRSYGHFSAQQSVPCRHSPRRTASLSLAQYRRPEIEELRYLKRRG